jgi:hypothetical protein
MFKACMHASLPSHRIASFVFLRIGIFGASRFVGMVSLGLPPTFTSLGLPPTFKS